MIAVEVLVGILIVTVIIVGIVKIGAPLADAFAERLKLKFQELGPEEERAMKARLDALEEEVRSLKRQMANIQDAEDFSSKLQPRQQEAGGKIEIPNKKTL
jgi:hypothetical protein